MGLSGFAVEKGLHRSKFMVHHYPDQGNGFVWSIFGKAPGALEGLNLLPANTVIASSSQFDLPGLWSVIETEVKAAGYPEVDQQLAQAKGMFAMMSGMEFDKFMTSLGGEYGVAITLDKSQPVQIPGATPTTIPRPDVLIFAKANDSLIYDRLLALAKAQEMRILENNADGVKTASVPLPVPIGAEYKGTLAYTEGLLLLATSPALVREALAVRSGDKPGLTETPEFKRLAQGIPTEANSFNFVSETFGEIYLDFQMKSVEQTAADSGVQETTWLREVMETIAKPAAAYGVFQNTSEGWLWTGNSSTPAATRMAAGMLAAPAGLLAAIAIPNFVKARSTAQKNSCIANLSRSTEPNNNGPSTTRSAVQIHRLPRSSTARATTSNVNQPARKAAPTASTRSSGTQPVPTVIPMGTSFRPWRPTAAEKSGPKSARFLDSVASQRMKARAFSYCLPRSAAVPAADSGSVSPPDPNRGARTPDNSAGNYAYARRFRLFLALAALLLPPVSSLAAGSSIQIDFQRDIAPIFERACISCHGLEKEKSGLRLDDRRLALRGGDEGPAIIPGKSEQSLLIRLVSGEDPDRLMPPKGERLTPDEINLLKSWINQGAAWPEAQAEASAAGNDQWWLAAPMRHPAPEVADADWRDNPIDAFVLSRLEHGNLSPSPPADRATLIRRMTYDLTGLPPSPEEVQAFVNDASPRAVRKLVDRLLDSPRYGERWARHWLDIARFAESQGFERDKIKPHAWRYRDYVIKSFNEDKPYDQFVREQIAGDVLPGRTRDRIIATGFLVAGAYDEVGLNQQSRIMRARTREEALEDVVGTVGQTFLGLTVNCGRCHSHKSDPISQEDYYRLKAVFEGVNAGDRDILPPDELKTIVTEINRLNARIKRLTTERADQDKKLKSEALEPSDADGTRARLRQIDQELREAREALSHAEARRPRVFAAVIRQPAPTHRLARGDAAKPREVIAPGALAAIVKPDGSLGLKTDSPEGERRAALARWIATPENPLTARVIVNRVWQWHFGKGIVDTPNDFGAMGGRPSHPRLLDRLAVDFMANGWSLKWLHEQILLSRTYQQSSAHNSDAAKIDAGNRLLWRFSPRRLEAEAVRDSLLSLSAQINFRMGGPGYMPWNLHIDNTHFYTWEDKIGADYNRRTVYRLGVLSARDSLLQALDCPNLSTRTPTRASTTTPIQALALMNNAFVQRQVHHFAERLRETHPDNPAKQIQLAYQSAFARDPSQAELARARDTAGSHGLDVVCWAIFNSNELVYLR